MKYIFLPNSGSGVDVAVTAIEKNRDFNTKCLVRYE